MLLTRGHHAAPWNLHVWEALPERFDVVLATTNSNAFDLEDVRLGRVQTRTLRDLLPRGPFGDLAARVAGDRYLRGREAIANADILHAEEISFWFGAEGARLRRRPGQRLVLTVWETIPLLRAYRSPHARRHRSRLLEATDLFLPTTERARAALLLEGAPPDRIRLWSPGIDVERFRAATPLARRFEHVILSPGRLVWEKGHQDVLRAVAALEAGLVARPSGTRLRVLLVGRGPEERRLRAYARELGIGELVTFASVRHADMPTVYARASCMVLASLPSAGGGLHPGDVPRIFWEEQFGMVLAEAMAAGLPIIASSSGAIPEVAGRSVLYFPPGDWRGLAELVAREVLSRPTRHRIRHPSEQIERYSIESAASRLEALYDELLSAAPREPERQAG